MINEIIFEFEEGLEVLAGNPFGQEVYEKQLKGKFDFDKTNKFVFPATVDTICSSFVQGLMKTYLESYTPEQLNGKIQIDNPEQYDDFIEGLYD